MATSVGQINFGVGIDASGIAAELNRELAPALAAVQQRLDRNPLNVKIDIDTRRAITKMQRELAAVRPRTIKVDVEVNLTEAQIKQLRSAASAIRRLDSKRVRVDFESTITDAAIAQMRAAASAIRRLDSKVVDVQFDTNLTTEQVASLRAAASAIRRLESKHIVIRVDIQADEARLRALAEVLRGLRDRNLRVGVDTDHSNVDRLARSLGSLTKFTTVGAGIAAGLSVIVGAAGAAAGAVGGLVVGLAALGPALGAIGATAAVGLQGVGGAFSALSDMSANAAADARTQSDAIESASESVTSALDAQESAQLALNNAQESAADAAKAVADAYKTAQERLDGYTQSLRESTLDQAEAELDLAEARKKLATGKFTDPLDRQRAILAVERAELNLQKAQKAGAKLQAEAAEAQEKGIDQADEVVAARKNQAKADQDVVTAQKALVRSNEAVAKAYKDLAEAQSSAGASSQKFADALAQLAPNAQDFVLAFRDLVPTLKDLKNSVQDTLFADLAGELSQTAEVVLPALKEGMQGIAGELNAMAKNAFEFLRSEQGMRGLNAAFASGQQLLEGLRSGTGEFTQGLIDMTVAAEPHMKAIGQGIAGIFEGIGKALSDAAANGKLDALFTGFEQVLASLKPLLDGIVSALIEMGAQVLPALAPLFKTLGQVIEAIAPSLGQIGAIFVNSLNSILPVLGDLIKALAEGLQPVLPVISMLLKTIGTAIQPLIEPFSRIAIILGEVLINTINALAPALEPLATAFADLLDAIAPLIPLIASNLSVLIQALAPALSVVFKALAPVIQSFAEQMTPVFKSLAPVLSQVAMTLGQALADALTQLAPLLPPLIQAWSQLILAVAPLLPELADLAVTLLPILVDAMVALTPVLVKWTEMFTWLVEHVIKELVIPAIDLFVTYFEGMGDAVHSTVTWLTDTVFPALGSALDTVQGWFGTAVAWIGDKWAELKEKAAVPINFVIETVFNNGLFRAWRNIDGLLGGVLPDVTNIAPIPTHATGGAIGLRGGAGNGTKDDILSWLSNGEHVVTAAEVLKAGGQNILYAIRDMIARGIPFTWDSGRIITDLGRDNLAAYGAKVKAAGLGNVPPEGLFDPLARGPIPQFRDGGKIEIFPWMYQLAKGHDFARAQDGKAYKWAGPQFVGDSFDCSGFMGSVAAAILGGNPWQRYWSTASFSGYPQVGPQGFVRNLKEGSGFAIGVTDDPGGPGGGHTAGELRGIPELGYAAARVESGGALGNVHVGRGTDPNSFAALYGLPIGANGFFEPAPGGSSAGPSTGEQQSFLSRTIETMIKAATDPVRELIKTQLGPPPPLTRTIPPAVLDATTHYFAESASHAVTNLGGLLGGAWQRAKDLGSGLLSSLNPFDSGGIASGTGILTKNTIEPERILSPEQTALFEQLVAALMKIASTGLSAASQAAQTVTVDLSRASVDALRLTLGLDQKKAEDEALNAAQFTALAQQITDAQAQTGELFSDTTALLERTATSQDVAAQAAADEQMKQLLDIANRLSNDVLGPIMAAAVGAGTDFLTAVLDGVAKDVVTAVNGTTRAVNNVSDTIESNDGGGGGGTPAFGAPGSSFDALSAVSDAVSTVANAATAAFNKVRDDIVAAALKQTRSKAGESKGLLGKDIDGGFLVNLIVSLTGVEIEVRDLLENTLDEITAFREGSFNGFTENGELISDTAALVQRTASSMELAASEQERIQKALIKAVIKYLILNVLIPIITAILGAMITLATTAIGAAIGSAIPVIGTVIGALVGAAVGAALAGLAAVFTSLLAVGAGAAIDAFDEGGIAPGVGMMPKNTIAPERVLSPRQTASFERLVEILDNSGAGGAGNRSVSIGSMTVNGTGAADKSADRLLQLLNT